MNLEELVLGITQFLFGTQCSKSVLCFFSVASRHLWFDTRRSPVAAASGPLAVQTTTWREWRIAAQLQKKVARPWLENEFLGMLNAKKTGIHRQYVQLYTYNIECTIIYIYIHMCTHTHNIHVHVIPCQHISIWWLIHQEPSQYAKLFPEESQWPHKHKFLLPTARTEVTKCQVMTWVVTTLISFFFLSDY